MSPRIRPYAPERDALDLRRYGKEIVWRRRMASDEAKGLYKLRAATAECVNAQTRDRGLVQFTLRGCVKARAAFSSTQGLLGRLAGNKPMSISCSVATQT